jgi:large subunit ribosomal protein L13
MKTAAQPTTLAKKETVQPTWYVIDATDLVVGRLAVTLANVLRGKHKPE